MTSRVSTWFWKVLGGQVSEDGTPEPHEDDPVVIFTGPPDEARRVRQDLEGAGFTVTANARVADDRPLAVDLGTSAKPSMVSVEIRAGDLERATRHLDATA